MRTANDGTGSLTLEVPPCLKRRGPAWVDLRMADGSPGWLDALGYQLRAGRRYSLIVRTPTADGSGRVQLLEAEMDDALHVLTPPACVSLKDGLELTVRFKPRLVWPFPHKTVIVVNSRAGPAEEPIALAIPVVVRPSLLNQMTWMVSVSAPIALAKLATLSNKEGDLFQRTLVDALENVWTWVSLLLLFCGVLLTLRLAGWLWIRIGWRE